MVDEPGRWEYTVGAWIDAAATWRDELRRKVDAGQTDLEAELSEGAALLGIDVPDPDGGPGEHHRGARSRRCRWPAR